MGDAPIRSGYAGHKPEDPRDAELRHMREYHAAQGAAMQELLEGKDYEIARLRGWLREIAAIAKCSSGVEFYAMLATQALDTTNMPPGGI